ncbi:hypothetical protein ONE63_011546 [Megalurothrips usitatus]|uniref:Uncharacterized protein n=1 Tax=Megalurothrips usitatus TaxID=439358 RepID=A0AAV7X329_9NEOP|nr:hypothetical protein ONE63_011546 [Megalurothrips usitatus]
MVLVALFGRSALEENAITAKGQKSGTLGIRKHVRAAIRAFVNRNKGPTYSDLTEANFNRVINRKKNQVHRSLLKKTPQPQKKKTKSPKKTPKPQTPQQKTPTPKETDQAPERRPMSSIRSSPFNEQEVQSGPPVRSMASIMGSPLDERMQRTPNSVVASPSKQQWSVTSYQMPPSQQVLPSHQMPPSHDYSSYQGLTGFNYTSQGEEKPNQYSDQFSSQFSNQFSQYSTGNSNCILGVLQLRPFKLQYVSTSCFIYLKKYSALLVKEECSRSTSTSSVLLLSMRVLPRIFQNHCIFVTSFLTFHAGFSFPES